jgi:hypothetical protein
VVTRVLARAPEWAWPSLAALPTAVATRTDLVPALSRPRPQGDPTGHAAVLAGLPLVMG